MSKSLWGGTMLACLGLIGWGLHAGVVALASPGQATQSTASIYVGPNIRISTDSDKYHTEPTAATGAGIIIAGATVGTGDGYAMADRGYISRDNGNTWSSLSFTEMSDRDVNGVSVSGDAAVGVGAQRRLFYGGLGFPKDPNAQPAMLLYHSDDMGRTWTAPKALVINDHEKIFTDPARRLVVVVGLVNNPTQLVAYVSRNNGDSFLKPVVYIDAGKQLVDFEAFEPVEMPDGSLFLPYQVATRSALRPIYAVLLHPQTLSVSAPRLLFRWNMDGDIAKMILASRIADLTDMMFRQDSKTTYAVYPVFDGAVDRIVVRTSRDLGRTWTAYRYLAPSQGLDQFAPVATVNRQGLLGIAWSQMVDGTRFNELFTATVDGGKTFLPPRVISTKPSMPFTVDNLTGKAFADREKGGFGISERSGFLDRAAGGDYFGMVADAAGVFHPVWIDSRDAVGGQLYTTAIAVLRQPSAGCSARNLGASEDLAKQLEIVIDPMRVDMGRGEMVFPIRLRNIGTTAIAGPVTFTVTDLSTSLVKIPTQDLPRIVGSANGKTGVGATLDFTHAFGDYSELPPHAVSNPVDLRVTFAKPLIAPEVVGSVTGTQCRF